MGLASRDVTTSWATPSRSRHRVSSATWFCIPRWGHTPPRPGSGHAARTPNTGAAPAACPSCWQTAHPARRPGRQRPRGPEGRCPARPRGFTADRTVRSRAGSAAGSRERRTGHRGRIAAVTCAGATTLGPCTPGLSALGARHWRHQREHRLRGDRRSWTERSAGETRSREERLRGRTADRLNGDPQGPDPGNAGEGRPPPRPGIPGADSGGSQECVRSWCSAAAPTPR